MIMIHCKSVNFWFNMFIQKTPVKSAAANPIHFLEKLYLIWCLMYYYECVYVYCAKYYKTKQATEIEYTKECSECLTNTFLLKYVSVLWAMTCVFRVLCMWLNKNHCLANSFVVRNYHMNNVECSQSTSLPLKFTTVYIHIT